MNSKDYSLRENGEELLACETAASALGHFWAQCAGHRMEAREGTLSSVQDSVELYYLDNLIASSDRDGVEYVGLNYEQFRWLPRGHKRAYLDEIQREYDATPGEKITVDLSETRAKWLMGQISGGTYRNEIYFYGPACLQFSELVR